MPLGKTPILQNELMAEGDNQKYLLFNDALVALEDASNRSLPINLSANDVALTETQTTRFAVIECGGNTTARTLTIPISVGSPPVTTNRVLAVRNTGTASLTVTHNNSGADITVPAGSTSLVYCNGTDIISLGGVSNAATFPIRSDGSEVVSALRALNFVGTGFTIVDSGSGTATIEFTIPTTLLGMTDTPGDFGGHAGKVLAVSATEDGVEFIANPGMTDASVKMAYENNADTNAFTDAEKTKLSSVEPNATADMTGAEIKAAYESEANTNAFTDAEKAKLATVDSSLFKGTFLTEGALTSAHPTAALGSYAYVDAGIGVDVVMYIWDDDDSTWVANSGGSSGGTETAASVKTKYESNADTNAFTDAEKTKLSSVEPNATADMTGAEIVSAVNSELGGTGWQGGGGSGGVTAPVFTEQTAVNYDVTDADLSGTAIVERNNNTANTVTVPPGLTGMHPVNIVQTGTGTTTIVQGPGVSISSLNDMVDISGQYGFVTLIPKGSDTYLLVGSLA
ncbi:tail fiber protein [Phaeobacter phage MD18]|nr:tail fiber protein [Phaeobacter phage MD18]